MNKKSFILIALVLFSGYLFLFGLGKMPLTDPDEPFYAETAREMLERGEWLTPRIFDEPQFEKPPLYYWLVILSFKAFGINEFAARFPSAIFGILGVIGIFLLARLLFTQKTAIFSAIAAATGIEYIILSRACVTDIVLTVFILYFFLFFFYGLEKKRKIFFSFAAISIALGVLTKGPVALALPLFVIALFFLLKKEFLKLFKLPFILPVIIFSIVAVPWYYLMYKVYGNDFTSHFFGFQNITRFLEPEHKMGDVFYYYLPVIFGGFFPWSIFLPCGIFTIIKEDKEKFKKHLFLLLWAAVFFVFFSASRTKLPTYIFPLFPALAILTGRFWEIIISKKSFNIGAKLSGIVYIFIIPAGIIILYIFSFKKYPFMAGPIAKSGIFILPLFMVSVIFFIKNKIAIFLNSIAFTLAAALIPLTLFLGPVIGKYEASKDIALYLKKVMKPNEKIGVETDYMRGIAFYLGITDIIDIHPHHVITKFLPSEKRVWVVMKDKNHRQLYTDRDAPFRFPTYMVYKFGKKVIITNKIPADGKYIKERSLDNPE